MGIPSPILRWLDFRGIRMNLNIGWHGDQLIGIAQAAAKAVPIE
jgi:hypothetical protein